MKKDTKWSVIIEDGPTAAHCHKIIVEASSSIEAYEKAEEWSNKMNIKNPMYSRPVLAKPSDVPILDDDYTDIIEWTPEEEEEFLRIADKDNIDRF